MDKNDRHKIKACVGVIVLKDEKILLGKRRGKHGSGEYSCPGGHLEFGESFVDCVKRETKEESGVDIGNVRFASVANIIKHVDRQDVLLNFVSDWVSGEVVDDNNEKIGEWDWYSFDNLPQPLFYPTEVLIDSYKINKNFYDKE